MWAPGRLHPGCRENEIGNDAQQPGCVLGQHHLLAQEAHEVAIGLEQRRAPAAQHTSLDLAHQPGQQRRQRQHQHHLCTLHEEVEDHGHSASTRSSATRAANTRLRNWRMVRNCRWLSRSAAITTLAAIGA